MSRPPDQKGGRMLQVLLGLGYGGAVLALPVLWFLGGRPPSSGGAIETLGNGLLMAAVPVLAFQPVLAGRLRILDRAFGLDTVYVFHKTMGLVAASLLMCASIVLASAGGFLIRWTWTVTAVLVALLVCTALLSRRLPLRYETWRLTHAILAAAVILRALVHAFVLEARSHSVGAEEASAALFLLAALTYLNHRVLGPLRRGRKAWTVESVRPETHNVWTLTLRPPAGGRPLVYLPGQFQFLTFDGGRGEEHPFTISSGGTVPGPHSATIKGSGDFTRAMGATIRPGDRVAVQGPFGRFSYALHPGERDLVFIAGGIGITPIMSMLRHMKGARADIDALLLYANATEKDIVFRKELEDAAQDGPPRLSVVHVLAAADDSWRGERGRIDAAVITRYVSGYIRAKVFYICGPPPMMAALIRALYEMGVPPGNIRFERFAL